MKWGRKALILVMHLILLMCATFAMKKLFGGNMEGLEVYAKWATIAYGMFVGGNTGITVSNLIKNGGKNNGNE